MSTVLIGVPDAAVVNGTTWEVNKIGGSPDVMLRLPSLVCEQCQADMVHVIQIYCPLELSPFHRVLHIFACISKPCWNKPHGWKVYRSQLRDKSSVSPSQSSKCQEKVSMETSDWCDEADDWGCDEESQSLVAMVSNNQSNTQPKSGTSIGEHRDPEMPAQMDSPECPESVEEGDSEAGVISQLEELDMAGESSEVLEEDSCLHPDKAAIENALSYLATNNSQCSETVTKENLPVEATCRDSFKSFYLDVFDEPVKEMSDAHHVTKLLKEYERKERVDVSSFLDCDRPPSGGKTGSVEKYEKTELKHGDKFFHKFMKRLKICPEQVVRYEYGGSPLPISHPRGELVPSPCSTCRSPRVFELQLVPPLIPYLTHSKASGPAVEFGTVMVFTCSQSCWQEDSPAPREEFLIVQSDPDQHLFKV